MSRHGGFTLIELMIVVAIIGILAAVAIPKFADLVRKSQEGATKGQSGAIRSALRIYYADTEGLYPQGPKTNPSTILTDSLVPTYLKEMPRTKLPPYHPPSNLVATHETPYTHDHDHGYWGYGSFMADSGWGDLWIMCEHTDSKSTVWSDY